jgi:putative ABC transport system substrate-binding protein
MNRRDFVTLLGGAAATWPMAARGQEKFWRVGVLVVDSQALSPDHEFAQLVQGLRDLGYVEGRNIIFDWRFAEGSLDRLAAHAATLARLNVNVIVAWSGIAIRAAQQATSTIPIVMVATTDPVGSGFVESLARPGGNITGSSTMSVDFSPKQLELLMTAVPRLTRVAVLGRSGSTGFDPILHTVEEGARPVGVAVVRADVAAESPAGFEQAFAVIERERAEAFIISPGPFMLAQRRRIADLAIRHRVASIANDPAYAMAGIMMSYGPDRKEMVRRAVVYVDRILKGTKPGDLPIVQPTLLPFVINLKTAKAIGLDISPNLIARTDEVIE